jgi:hypothetical protein
MRQYVLPKNGDDAENVGFGIAGRPMKGRIKLGELLSRCAEREENLIPSTQNDVVAR